MSRILMYHIYIINARRRDARDDNKYNVLFLTFNFIRVLWRNFVNDAILCLFVQMYVTHWTINAKSDNNDDDGHKYAYSFNTYSVWMRLYYYYNVVVCMWKF